MSSQPLPRSAPLYRANSGFCHTVLLSQRFERDAFCRSDGHHVLFCDLSPALLATKARPMLKLVRDIFKVCHPRQVAGSIVHSISVQMRRLMASRTFSVECARDNLVEKESLRLSFYREGDGWIGEGGALVRLENITHTIPASVHLCGCPYALDPAVWAGSIIRREGYRYPIFNAIFNSSHGAVPSRGGQGQGWRSNAALTRIFLAFQPKIARRLLVAAGLQDWIRAEAAINRSEQ